MMKLFVFTSFLAMLAVPLQASPPIGAFVQTWHYDPQTKGVIITLANTTHKDILAFNLSITETFGDGSRNFHEVMTDLLDRTVNAQLVKGTADEAQFTQQFGTGTFAAGSTFSENVAESKDVTNMAIIVDMVAYADRTADVQNDHAFAQLIAYRQGELLAMQLANEVIEKALASPNPSEAAATELKRRITVLHAQNLAPTDPQRYEESHLQGAVMNLSNRHPNMTETDHLKKQIATRQERIALVGPHVRLSKGEANEN